MAATVGDAVVIYMIQVTAAGGLPGLLMLNRGDRERVVLAVDNLLLLVLLLLFIFVGIFLFQRAGQTERLRIDSYHVGDGLSPLPLFLRLLFLNSLIRTESRFAWRSTIMLNNPAFILLRDCAYS